MKTQPANRDRVREIRGEVDRAIEKMHRARIDRNHVMLALHKKDVDRLIAESQKLLGEEGRELHRQAGQIAAGAFLFAAVAAGLSLASGRLEIGVVAAVAVIIGVAALRLRQRIGQEL